MRKEGRKGEIKKIRLGIIGCGSMNTNHERAFLMLKNDIEALQETKRFALKKTAKRLSTLSIVLKMS